MEDSTDKTPAVLSYASTAEAGGWPVGWYVAALVWAFVTLRFVSPYIVKRPEDLILIRFCWRVQIVFLTAAALRLVWATVRSEKSRSWILYIILLALAAPLWLPMESAGYALGR
jgi:hypothetical protein